MADSQQDFSSALAAGAEQARRLKGILEEEFDALREQNLTAFENLQGPKEQILASLGKVVQAVTAASAGESPLKPEDSPHWVAFQGLMSECRDAHRRNDILIRNKLDTIRATLRILQNSENTASVDVYDRLGRISPQMNRRGYSDA